MNKSSYVYILASGKNGTLYIGITSDLIKRIWEHKNHVVNGFSQKYNVTRLVYFESFDDIEQAINREKRLKKYKREAKIKLIEKENPNWDELYEMLF